MGLWTSWYVAGIKLRTKGHVVAHDISRKYRGPWQARWGSHLNIWEKEMAYQDQQQPQRPATNRIQLTDEQAASIAQLTTREGWLEFTVEDIKLIAEDFPPCPPSTAMLDFKKFIYLSSQKGLNPILGDLHYEFHGDKRSPTGVKGVAVIHQSAELKIASRTGLLDGIHQEDGQDERGLYVITRVYKKGCGQPFYFKAYHNEFVQANGFLWPKAPWNMTAKCSRVGALRIAFPEQLSGLVNESEVDDGYQRNGYAEPAAPVASSIKIGDKIGDKSEVKISPSPEVLKHLDQDVKAQSQPAAQAPVAAPAASAVASSAPIQTTAPVTESAAPKIAPDDYGAQYKARLLILGAKDSAYVKAGMNKTHVDKFLFGYFGVENKGQLGKQAPDKFPIALDYLITALSANPGDMKSLLEDPVAYGSSFRQRLDQDAEQDAKQAPSLANELQAKFKWNAKLALLAEKLLVKNGITDLDALGKMLTASMPNFTEPQLEIAFLIAYYSSDALAALLKCHFAKKMPLSFFRQEVEKIVLSDLSTLELDPVKVSEAVDTVIAGLEKK